MVADFTREGNTAFMFARAQLARGLLNEALTFAHARVDYHKDGFKLVTMTNHVATSRVNTGSEGHPLLKKGHRKGKLKLGKSWGFNKHSTPLQRIEKAMLRANAAVQARRKIRKFAPKAAMLMVLKNGDAPMRSVLRMAIPKKSLSRFFATSYHSLEIGSAASALTQTFKKIAKLPEVHQPHDDDGRPAEWRTDVIFQASVVHGTKLKLSFGGDSFEASKDGTEISVHAPLTMALTALAVPVHLGQRRTLVKLDVPWEALARGPARKPLKGGRCDALAPYSCLQPSLVVDAKDLSGKTMATRRGFGHEITVDEWYVHAAAPSPLSMAPRVSIASKIRFRPYAGSPGDKKNWGVDPEIRPPAQKLFLVGEVGKDVKQIDFSVTSEGATPGTWKEAFGEKALTLDDAHMNFTLVPGTSPRTLAALCPASPGVAGSCGVADVHVGGDATLLLDSSDRPHVLKRPLHGHIDIGRPENSQFRLGSMREGSASFKVRSELPKAYQHLVVSFPVTSKELKKNEKAALAGHSFSKTSVKKLKTILADLGAHLQNKKVFRTKNMEPTVLALGKKHELPFNVKYEAEYFGHPYKTVMGFTLGQLTNARKGKYKVATMKALCPTSNLLHIGQKYTQAQAERHCDSLAACKSFMFKKNGAAWFCSVDMSQYEVEGSHPGWSVGVRESDDVHLLHTKDMQEFVRIGVEQTMPKVFKQKFRRHGGLYGFEFKPKVIRKAGEHWLTLKVTPTRKGYKMTQKTLHNALMEAAGHVALVPVKNTMNQRKIKGVHTVAAAVHAKMKNVEKKGLDGVKHISNTIKNTINHAISGALGPVGKGLVSIAEARGVKPDRLSHNEYQKLLKKGEKASVATAKSAATLLTALNSDIKAAEKMVHAPVKKAVQLLKKRHPRLSHIEIEPLYLQCVYHPSKCDEKKLLSPKIKVCFTELGCSKLKHLPGMLGFLDFMQEEAAALMAAWLSKVMHWRKKTFKFPGLVSVTPRFYTVEGETREFNKIGKLEVENIRMKFPVMLHKLRMKKIAAKPATKRPHIAKHFARGLREHMLRAALKGLDPHVKGAVMMGAAHEMAKLKGKVGKHKGKRAALAFQAL
jgi:hypothetical protein